MPVVDRRQVRRESCRADRPADHHEVVAALNSLATAVEIGTALIADSIENGFADLTATLRKEEL